jgi:hypothetical protein
VSWHSEAIYCEIEESAQEAALFLFEPSIGGCRSDDQPSGSALHRAQRNATDHVTLQEPDDNENWQCTEHRHGRDFGPKIGLPAKVTCYLNGISSDLSAGCRGVLRLKF